MLVFVLIGVHQNKLNDVLNKLRSLGNKYLNKVHLVYGEYDIIAELKALNPESSASILKNIRDTDGVIDLKTYVASDQLPEDDYRTLQPIEEYLSI